MSRISMAVLPKVRPSSLSSLSPLPSSSSSWASASASSASLVELFYNSDFLDEERDGVQVSYNVLFYKRSRVENKFSIARITEFLSFKESGSYNLRSNSSCEFKVPKTKWGQGLRTCWPLTVEHSPLSYQEYLECSRFQAGPVNQFVHSDCGVLSVMSVMSGSFYQRFRICI